MWMWIWYSFQWNVNACAFIERDMHNMLNGQNFGNNDLLYVNVNKIHCQSNDIDTHILNTLRRNYSSNDKLKQNFIIISHITRKRWPESTKWQPPEYKYKLTLVCWTWFFFSLAPFQSDWASKNSNKPHFRAGSVFFRFFLLNWNWTTSKFQPNDKMNLEHWVRIVRTHRWRLCSKHLSVSSVSNRFQHWEFEHMQDHLRKSRFANIYARRTSMLAYMYTHIDGTMILCFAVSLPHSWFLCGLSPV